KGDKINYSYDQGDNSNKGKKEINKPNTNDFNNFIAINQIFMWVSNNGMGSNDPRTDGSGFYWPGGENATISAVFEDGLIWGAKVDTQIRVNGSTYRHGLQAGKILPNGEADNFNQEKYRVYKIRKGWENLPFGPTRDAYEKDYKEWPVADGAHWVDKNGDGIYTIGIDEPEFTGDEVLWCVMNDLDSSRSTYTYGTDPMGLEVQMTVYGFNRQGDLGDVVIKKYTLINKGSLTLKDMNLAYWSDPDLGNASDDYVGCDTLLNLGYCYNGDNNDEGYYGSNPPAVGYVLLQGPTVLATENDSAKFLGSWRSGFKNLPMTAFIFYIGMSATSFIDPDLGRASGSIQFYNNMTGKDYYGKPIIDPTTGAVTKTILSGDPVIGTGWYEGPVGWPGGPLPGDRRLLVSSGTFNIAPGDTQEVVVGILMGRGTSNLNSITELKRKTKLVQLAYDRDFKTTPLPKNPIVTSTVDDKQIALYWEPNAENYNEIDPWIVGKGKLDTTYNFEGYRIWQFEDEYGKNPKLLKINDIQNDVTKVTQSVDYDGVIVEQTLFQLPNMGIGRYFSTNIDKITNTPLVNGTPYYFGVTAFGYSKASDPKYLESPIQIIKVVPEKISYDSTYTLRYGSYITAKHSFGADDGDVQLFVVDPLALTGDTYKVTFDSTYYRNFTNTSDSVVFTYNLLNVSKALIDTLLKSRTEFGVDNSTNKFITDGFSLVVRNTGLDSISKVVSKYRVKSVEEIKGPGGVVLPSPQNVWDGKLNSTGKWTVSAKSQTGRFNWQTAKLEEGMGYADYEIRFTDSSSYYLSGLTGGLNDRSVMTKLDSLCKTGKLPFEIWYIGKDNDPNDDKRLILKVLDRTSWKLDSTVSIPDRKWTHLANGNWEQVFAFTSATLDPNNLPAKEPVASKITDHKIGGITFTGELPEPGTVIKISGYKPLVPGDEFTVTAPKAILSDVNDKSEDVNSPNTYALDQNYPNPFNPNTTISYSIANPGLVTVKIFNILGEEILQLVNEYKNSGSYTVNFDASKLSSGIYFYSLRSGNFISTKKMIVLK
ncbi:MAG: T9SS type A sorting domain-containing protein, partial [Ignavibacteriaceae bacterium]